MENANPRLFHTQARGRMPETGRDLQRSSTSGKQRTRNGMPQQLTYYNNNIHVQHRMTSCTSASSEAYVDKNLFTSRPLIDAIHSPFPRSDTPPAGPSASHNYSITPSHLRSLILKVTSKSRFPEQGGGPQPPQQPSLTSRSTCESPKWAEIDSLGPAGMHERKYNHSCHIPGCGKIFGESSDLKAHLRCHTGERPFVCTWSSCGHRFKRSTGLKRHLRIHTDEKRFACKICSKGFTMLKYLSQHEKTHTSDKQFACMFCAKRFTRSYNLSQHEMTHTAEKQFACKICNKQFTRSVYLSQHEKTHTAEKQFACMFCAKRFTRSYNLSQHEMTHTAEKEKQFACNICNKRFATSRYLSQHAKTHIAREDRKEKRSRSGKCSDSPKLPTLGLLHP